MNALRTFLNKKSQLHLPARIARILMQVMLHGSTVQPELVGVAHAILHGAINVRGLL